MGDFLEACFVCMELSTPFVAFRIILSELGLKESKLYAINGIAMMVSFFTCRVFVFPFMYWMYGRALRISGWDVPYAIPWHCNIGCIGLMGLQLYWFSLMVRGALRILTKKAGD